MVSLTNVTGGALQQGRDAVYSVTVSNATSNTLTNVGVTVSLPAQCVFVQTLSDSSGTVPRTSPQEPAPDTPNPVWGTWSLGPKGTSSSTLTIQFQFLVSGPPGSYTLVADATDEQTTTTASVKTSIQGEPAYRIGVGVTPSNPMQGTTVEYAVTVVNTGSGGGQDVELLLNLPPGVQYLSTLSISAGSGAVRNPVINPPPGSEAVFYGDWTINGFAANEPTGVVTIDFAAAVLPDATPGPCAVTGQLTDGNDTVIPIVGAAKMTIVAKPVPSPSLTPTPTGGLATATP